MFIPTEKHFDSLEVEALRNHFMSEMEKDKAIGKLPDSMTFSDYLHQSLKALDAREQEIKVMSKSGNLTNDLSKRWLEFVAETRAKTHEILKSMIDKRIFFNLKGQ